MSALPTYLSSVASEIFCHLFVQLVGKSQLFRWSKSFFRKIWKRNCVRCFRYRRMRHTIFSLCARMTYMRALHRVYTSNFVSIRFLSIFSSAQSAIWCCALHVANLPTWLSSHAFIIYAQHRIIQCYFARDREKHQLRITYMLALNQQRTLCQNENFLPSHHACI